MRIWLEEPCEHGQLDQHALLAGQFTANTLSDTAWCPGGQRRELTGVEVVEPRYTAAIFDEITGSYRFVKPGRYAIIPLEEPADG